LYELLKIWHVRPNVGPITGRAGAEPKTRKKQAAVALGRRVLCWCWAMLRDESEWHVPTPRAPREMRATPALPAAIRPSPQRSVAVVNDSSRMHQGR
jgi:hypothetical protein